MSRLRIAAAVLALSLVACQDQSLTSPDARQPSFQILDGHSADPGANEHFFFLWPIRRLALQPPAEGFDPDLSPVIEICRLDATGCTTVRQLTTTTGSPLLNRVYVRPERHEYGALWVARDLEEGKGYRIRVLVDGHELGFADLDVVGRIREVLRYPDRDEYVPLLEDYILPIRFWIGVGAIGEEPKLTGVETRITANLADQWDPSISGNLIVYSDLRGYDDDTWYFDIVTGLEAPATTAAGVQLLSDVSGGVIVYSDFHLQDVFAFDVASGVTTNVSNMQGMGLAANPAISGSLVAWEDTRNGSQDIYARDLTGGPDFRVSSGPRARNPAVSAGRIVWESCSTNTDCDIRMHNGGEVAVTSNPLRDDREPEIDGTWIVYSGRDAATGDRDIYAYDITTGTERRLALPGDQLNPSISGNYVVFEDLQGSQFHLVLWDLTTGAVYPIPVNAASYQYLNDIDGNRVVYTDTRNGHLDIYMFTFTIGP